MSTIKVGKKRLNAHITDEAYQVITQNASPKTIGNFLSRVLIEYQRNHSLSERIRQIEREVSDVKAQVLLQEIQERHDRAMADPDGETVPFEQVMKEMNIHYRPTKGKNT